MTGSRATPPTQTSSEAGQVPATDVDRLRTAPFEVVGQFTDASNATLLVRLRDRDTRSLEEVADAVGRALTLEDLEPTDLAVYKPQRGEAPLHDFPAGSLHRREVAAFIVSEALGWDLVPPTVRVEHPTLGIGSVQRFVPHDPELHYFTLMEQADAEVIAQLQTLVTFDVVINNADRKAGHVLLEQQASGAGRVRAIDHGVSLHADPKLRTVAWDFIDEPVPGRLLADVDRLREGLAGESGAQLTRLLSVDEVAALTARCVSLLADGRFPPPQSLRPTPWPLL